ncbi:hypothetical protein BN8_04342 [Fibrisoma limi BUZ 3]|uniref:Lipoprotein n=1 Tax=Fibrisoma limi BUZ 3 TaxID=1185876 RepID=I2GMH9_9BACT|nr:hypothetical protein [Fibrisoma limi]CCH55107.1 hypothetical protein BN8_04342 [Fibrisoma limi BUZ 3]
MFSFTQSHRFLLVVSLGLFSTACDRNNDQPAPVEREAAFARLLVSDAETPALSLVNPAKGTSESFQAKFVGSNLYPTKSGRFALVLNYANNYVQFFDSGIENHNDHAHVVGTPKWATLTSEAAKPTHTYFWGNRIAVFNDGEGSLTLTREEDLHNASVKPKIVKVDVPHHGAVVAYSNNTFAVTEKDGTVASTLPERVKIVDENGTVLKKSVLATKGIHGDAGNGQVALFGHPDGILVVDQEGNQRNITYPASIGKEWLGTVMYNEGADAFYGFSAKAGVYRIDVNQNKITPVLESTQIAAFRVDNEGRDVYALLNDGTLQSFDGKTNAPLRSAKVIDVIDPNAKVKPDMTISRRFIYITQPDKGEIRVVRRGTLTAAEALKVSGKPAKVIVIGAQQDVEKDD